MRIRSSQLDSPLRRWVPPRYRDDSELAVALEHFDGHRHDAAEALNVSQPILRRRIRAAAPGTPLHRFMEHKGQQARRTLHRFAVVEGVYGLASLSGTSAPS